MRTGRAAFADIDGTNGENPLKHNLVDSVCRRTTEGGAEKIVVLAIVESTSEKARLASSGDVVDGLGWNASEFAPPEGAGYLYSSPPTSPEQVALKATFAKDRCCGRLPKFAAQAQWIRSDRDANFGTRPSTIGRH